MMLPPIPNLTETILIETDGRLCAEKNWDSQKPMVLLPGAFNPLHDGHLALAALVERIAGKPVAFELSVTNVDKPALTDTEVRRRLDQFVGKAPVWLTRAPLFRDKAQFFPGATFAIGVDTAARLLAPRYYPDKEAGMWQALDHLKMQNCRFLVAGRLDATGCFVGLHDIQIPQAYGDLFRAIPESEFRVDISSTLLRKNES